MYNILIKDLYTNNNCHNSWPYDQYYISKYIFENKEKFTIFIPDILNTPLGNVLRHNWCKNQKMYDDLNQLIALKNICVYKTHFVFKFDNIVQSKQYVSLECFSEINN